MSTSETPATEAPAVVVPDAGAQPEPTPTEDAGKGGKAAVLADLATERDKRQALEQQIQSIQNAQQAQTDALAKAFGLKPEVTSDDIVTTLQQQVAEMRHSTLVNDVARRHGITDDNDVAVLREVKDEALMTRLAERLKTPPGPTVPAPDPGQGARPSTPQAEADAAYEQFFPKTH